MKEKDVPAHLSYLFRAKPPMVTLRALHKPVYKNRPQQPLIDVHHAQGELQGLLGKVSADQGEKWLNEVFEDKKPAEITENKQSETKAESRKRIQKAKIKENLLSVERLKK